MFVVSFERLLKGPTESAFGKFHIYWVREYFGGFFFWSTSTLEVYESKSVLGL